MRLSLESARKAVFVLVPTWLGGTLYPSSAPTGAPAAPGRSASPCFAAESVRGGTLMSLPEGIATPAVRGARGGAASPDEQATGVTAVSTAATAMAALLGVLGMD